MLPLRKTAFTVIGSNGLFVFLRSKRRGAYPRHSVCCARFGGLAQHAEAGGNALFYLGNEALIVGVLRQPHRRKVLFKVEQVHSVRQPEAGEKARLEG